MTCLRPKLLGGYFQKNWVGVSSTLPETLPLFQTKICDFSYPISDLIKTLIAYFRLKTWSPARDKLLRHVHGSCCLRADVSYFLLLHAEKGPFSACNKGKGRRLHAGKVVGVDIKREMVLSPNDEEVANSSKKTSQFKTRVHKPYPISDHDGRN